jgi:hypothetical protein
MAEDRVVHSHVCSALDVLVTKVNTVQETVALHSKTPDIFRK